MTETAMHYDLIVIGGGINGAGIFREAAIRGMKVLLVEKNDLCSATSATSSRLIHGGLRYLEYYEVALVRESLRERERLLHAAPHLVKPLPLTIPIYDRSTRGPVMISMGMLAYDALSYDKSVPHAAVLKRNQAITAEPGLNPDGLRAAARYYDCQAIFPERLVVENVLDGVAHGGEVRTHAKVVGFVEEARVVRGVEFRRDGSDEIERAYAPVTMNVSGPWVDEVIGLAGSYPRQGGGTKGSHLVVKPFPGAPTDALYVEAAADGRPYFIIPWNKLYLIGTTDLRFEGDFDRVVASEDEITYLLNETNLVIPEANLTREDVLYTFSGVRPLPYKEEGSTGSITRKHIIKSHLPEIGGLYSIIGGKLTTYRSLSEEAVSVVQERLGSATDKSATRNRLLPGGAENWPEFRDRFIQDRPAWMSEATADWLVNLYGARAWDVVHFAERNPRYQQPIHDGHYAIVAVIPFSFEVEYAQSLADVMLRRTMIAMDADMGRDVAYSAAWVCQELFGWDDARRDAELAEFHTQISKQLPQGM